MPCNQRHCKENSLKRGGQMANPLLQHYIKLTEFLGQKCVGVDVNSMKPLDNLCHPVSVIREAEELAADAFGAALQTWR